MSTLSVNMTFYLLSRNMFKTPWSHWCSTSEKAENLKQFADRMKLWSGWQSFKHVMKRFIALSCEALARSLYSVSANSSNSISIQLLRQGLHDRPKNRRSALQTEIDAVDDSAFDTTSIFFWKGRIKRKCCGTTNYRGSLRQLDVRCRCEMTRIVLFDPFEPLSPGRQLGRDRHLPTLNIPKIPWEAELNTKKLEFV